MPFTFSSFLHSIYVFFVHFILITNFIRLSKNTFETNISTYQSISTHKISRICLFLRRISTFAEHFQAFQTENDTDIESSSTFSCSHSNSGKEFEDIVKYSGKFISGMRSFFSKKLHIVLTKCLDRMETQLK